MILSTTYILQLYTIIHRSHMSSSFASFLNHHRHDPSQNDAVDHHASLIFKKKNSNSWKIYAGIIVCFLINCVVLILNLRYIDSSSSSSSSSPWNHHRDSNNNSNVPTAQTDVHQLLQTIASLTVSDQRTLVQQLIHVLDLSPPTDKVSPQAQQDQQQQQQQVEENREEPFQNHRHHHRLAGKIPTDNEALAFLMNEAVEAIVSNTIQPGGEQGDETASSKYSFMQSIVENLNQLSFQEQNYIINQVNGQEYPFLLSCPRSNTLQFYHNHTQTEAFSVVVSYHVGLVNNWRDIVRDQMTTLELCGLGQIMTLMYVTYTKDNTNNTFQDLKQIMNRYTFASKITYQKGPENVIPFEASALNLLHDYCTKQVNKQEENSSKKKKSIVFYFHNKGCSHYNSNWRQRDVILETWTYSFALYWRKYMEYFLIERPFLCIDQIINHGADACGVHLIDAEDYDDLYYSGNFWAASCSHIQALKVIPTETFDPTSEDPRYKTTYIQGERWIGAETRSRNPIFVNFHNNTNGLYTHLIHPDEYSDYSYRWL